MGKRIYRKDTIRLKNWNYGWKGTYFITMVTKNRNCYFGWLVEDKVKLNALGKCLANEWLKTAEIRKPMNIKLGAFVVMPDHFHAIVSIGRNQYNSRVRINNTISDGIHFQKKRNEFGPQSMNLGAMIRGVKSAVKMFALNEGIIFSWQSGYYDRIIRNHAAFLAVTQYINSNPAKAAEKLKRQSL